MKPLGFVDPRSPAAITVGATEKDRRRAGLVVIRRMGRGSADCMVGYVVGLVDQRRQYLGYLAKCTL
jgi:hypothetical protein